MRNKHGKNAARATANEGASAVPDEKYSIGMAPLEFTRQQLVGPKSAIIEFARTHIYKNELAGLKLDRYDVVTMWWLNARKVFPRGDPKREEIMTQAGDSIDICEQERLTYGRYIGGQPTVPRILG